MFAAGRALIMVPVTLGISLVAGTIARYHAPLYYVGGTLMLLLAGYSLSGHAHARRTARTQLRPH